MRVVANNSEKDIARAAAEQSIKHALRRFGANMLRVIRGSGKPAELPIQSAAFIDAINAYIEVAGQLPPGELLASFLDPMAAQLEYRPWIADHVPSADEARMEHVKGLMQRATLQMIASDLLDQATQGSKAMGDHSAALFAWEHLMQERWSRLKKSRPKSPKADDWI